MGARPVGLRRVGLRDGLANGSGDAQTPTAGCQCGEIQQVLMWEPGEAWVVLEDPDCRPYLWDLPDE